MIYSSDRGGDLTLVIEGPDGSGKTTLANALSEELRWPLAEKAVAHDTTTTLDLRQYAEKTVEGGLQRKIFDRHCLISEPIYGPIMRGGLRHNMSSPLWYNDIWHRFLGTRPLIVFCLPPLDVVMKNIREDPDNLTIRDIQPQVWWQYWTLAMRINESMLYDYTDSANEDGRGVKQYAKLAQHYFFQRGT